MKKEYISGCLKGYAKSDAVRLHMPGHKGKGEGRACNSGIARIL